MFDKLKPHSPILILAVAHGTVDFYNMLLPPLAPSLSEHFGIPIGDMVAMVGLAALVTNMIQPIAGYFMQKRNFAWILWFSIMLSVCSAFMGFATGYWTLLALILVGAGGTGLFHPEGVLAADDASGDKAYLGVPFFVATGVAVSALAAPVSIQWVRHLGFPALAWLALPGLAMCVVMYFRHRVKKRRHPSVMLRPRSRRMTKVTAGVLPFMAIFLLACCFTIATGIFNSVVASHFELRFGPSARMWSGWVLSASGLLSSLVAFGWSALVKRRGFYLITFATQIIACPLFVLLAYCRTPQIGLLIAIPLSVFAPAALYPVAVSLARSASGLTQSMRASLIMGGAWGLSSVLVVVAGKVLGKGVDSTQLMLIPAACSLLVLLGSGWLLVRSRR